MRPTTRGRVSQHGRKATWHPVAAVLACLVLVGGVTASLRLATLSHLDAMAEARQHVTARLDHVRGGLSRELFASLNLANGLVELVSLRGGVDQAEFDALASAIVRRSLTVRNVALAPGTVIRYIHPRFGNESALGVDYMGVPNQRAAVLRAIRERRTVVAGPLALIQGGTGIIGRTPIFTRPTDKAGETYWGIAATVIDFGTLVETVGLERERETLRLSLRGLDGTGAEGPAFWGDLNVFMDSPVTMTVPLPSGSWELAGIPKDGWPVFVPWRTPELILGSILSLALAALLYAVLLVSRQRKHEVFARLTSEHELRQVNRSLVIKETAIESVTAGIGLLGLDGCVTYFNRALAAMVGGERIRVGSTLTDLLGQNAADAALRSLDENGRWRGEATLPIPDGPARDLDAAVESVRGSGGELIGRVLVLQDVTERKRLMTEVERGQRLGALSVFAGGVAHDVNNLLGGLFGNIELARAALEPGHAASAHLDTAATAFERARDLTRRLLTFAVGSPPERHRLGVVPFLRECCLLSMSGSACPWEIDEPPDGLVWDVFADANQLSQVVANVLVNARQAMPTGGRLRIRVRNRQFDTADEHELAAGRYVQIAFQDEGPGIPSHVLPRVFEPFFTTKPSGSGLGLAMSYSIVRAHRGRIAITSMPGGGAEVTLWLPAAPQTARPVDADVPPVVAEQPRSGRIILMDDERLVRDIAARMLARGGYDVVQAQDGQEALRLCRDALAEGKPFDAAILDVTVPGGMGGSEALRRLRELQPELAVVLSSGYGGLTVTEGDCQPTAVLPKPYQMHELLACARAVINPQRRS